MKIDRLIGIITVLLQKEKVTASYLAERFEVSTRTINRDMEDICKAGIPVVTTQGASGGIAIAEDYKIDKTLFSQEELRAVFIGLSGLDSVAQDQKYQNIIGKFFSDKNGIYAKSHIMIDLSSYYKTSLAPKIKTIEQAIDTSTIVEFDYFSSNGQRKVRLEPYLIVFQWSSWYTFGYDVDKDGFRLFKLNRLSALQSTEAQFEPRETPSAKPNFNGFFTDHIKTVILFDKSVKYRLIEDYGFDYFKTLDNEMLQFEFCFTNKEYLIEWVLRFGDKAELIKPVELREEIKSRIEKSLNKYL